MGIVVIGRNEGDRLRRCLAALPKPRFQVVYVDSGSKDGSADLAGALGVDVVELDPTSAYTAGRARNEGIAYLRSKFPQTEFVQFVDGDSELDPDWLDCARNELKKHPRWAVVFGHIHEENRNRNVYKRLLDIEFDTPLGNTRVCPGIAMVRARAFTQVGGFQPDLVAGEEPEMCLRLGRHGWRIVKINKEMAIHRSGMERFGQWWRRACRSGHAYAGAVWIHGLSRERLGLRESLSIWFWGLVLPGGALGLALPTASGSLLMLLGYPLLIGRIYRRSRKRDLSEKDAILYACFCVIGKWPQMMGQLRFLCGKLTCRQS